eukprot:m.126270 g.126270  ORF g.126270 m.126270 type:complete len:1460 (+) comp9705_c0_seq2:247-4626(+)
MLGAAHVLLFVVSLILCALQHGGVNAHDDAAGIAIGETRDFRPLWANVSTTGITVMLLPLGNRSLPLMLREARSFVHPTVPLAMQHGGEHFPVNSDIFESQWFHGQIDGDPSSAVGLSVSSISGVGGIIRSQQHGTFRLVRSTLQPGHTMVILEPDNENDLGKDFVHRDETLLHEGSEAHSTEGASTQSRRQRREGQLSAQHKVCTIFLEADRRFFKQWSGDGSREVRVSRTALHMAEIFLAVNAIFQDSDNLGGILGLQIAGILVHTDDPFDFGENEEGRVVLKSYQTYLGANATGPNVGQATHVRGPWAPTSQEVCLNHLFTHTNLKGYLGVATIASPNFNQLGGLCAHRLGRSAFGYTALNSAITSTKLKDAVASTATLIHSMAHELAHNLGAEHTCCGSPSSSCPQAESCPALDGNECNPAEKYLMYPSLVSGSNALKLSSCSKNQIMAVIEAKGQCLIRENPCLFGGVCCEGSQLRPKGVICRRSFSPCLEDSVCNGISPSCPGNTPANDGRTCRIEGKLYGQCYDGACRGIHDEFCETMLPGLTGCILEDSPCTRACRKSNGKGKCVQYSSACAQTKAFWKQSSKCEVATNGAACRRANGNFGVCMRTGTCRVCDEPGCDYLRQDLATTDPKCKWTKMPASECSKTCGEAFRRSEYHCVCDDGTIDATTLGCKRERPEDTFEKCSLPSCPTCTAVKVSNGVSFTARFEQTVTKSDGVAVYANSQRGLFLYFKSAFEWTWWAIGPSAGGIGSWRFFTRSDTSAIEHVDTPWFTFTKGVQEQTLPMTITCECDSPGLILDKLTGSCTFESTAAFDVVDGSDSDDVKTHATEPVYLINCGGPDFKSDDGEIWSGFTPQDHVFVSEGPISGTTLPFLYESVCIYRRSHDLTLPIPFEFQGLVMVRLRLVELDERAKPRDNVFHVVVQETRVLSQVDIVDSAGHRSALDFEFVVDAGPELIVSFSRKSGAISLAALEVYAFAAQTDATQQSPNTENVPTTATAATNAPMMSITQDFSPTDPPTTPEMVYTTAEDTTVEDSTTTIKATTAPVSTTTGSKSWNENVNDEDNDDEEVASGEGSSSDDKTSTDSPSSLRPEEQVTPDSSPPAVFQTTTFGSTQSTASSALTTSWSSTPPTPPVTTTTTTTAKTEPIQDLHPLALFSDLTHLYRISCGNPTDVVDASGVTWQTFRPPSFYSVTTKSINGTDFSDLYSSQCIFDSVQTLVMPIETKYAGSIALIRLHFAELFYTSPGRRIFDVVINGALVAESLDIFATVGTLAPLSYTFGLILGSWVNVTLVPLVGKSQLAGLELFLKPETTSATTPTSSVTPTAKPDPASRACNLQGCLDCTLEGQCATCRADEGWSLYNGACRKRCPSDYYPVNGVCELPFICHDGLREDNGKACECEQPECSLCAFGSYAKGRCFGCTRPHALLATSCLEACPDGYSRHDLGVSGIYCLQ